MTKLKEELKFMTLVYQFKPCDTIAVSFNQLRPQDFDKLWNWINQNYISKEQILNLECLKEESERFGDEFSYIRGQSVGRNQLRNEIIDEIKKL